LNTCATSGCHGPQSTCEMKLVRVQIGKGANRRLTQRNLHSVLQMIDREDPPGSRLLTAPIGPHGETGSPIFTSKQAVQYRQLVNWVSRVAQSAETEQPASVLRQDDKLLQRVAIRQWPDSSSATPATAATASGTKSSAPKDASGGAASAQPAFAPRAIDPAPAVPPGATKTRANKPLPPASTVDPFDPDGFNRRFSP